MSRFILFIAQGFGVGRIPFVPGTFGSVVGVLWFLALVATGSFGVYVGGMVAGVALSVWLCGAAEGILKQTDPGSVVLDEIVALPVCFLPWVTMLWLQHRAMPSSQYFLTDRRWIYVVAVFVLFRVFDIAKPWPVRQSQRLPGGWGVTTDDVLAAIYVGAISLLFVR